VSNDFSEVDRQIEANHAETRAKGVALVRDKLTGNRNARVDCAISAILDHWNRTGSTHLPAEDFHAFRSAIVQAAGYDNALSLLDKVEAASHTRAAVIRYEARTYGPANPSHSYFRDLCSVGVPDSVDFAERQAASDRLARHGREVATEMTARKSAEGDRARRVIRDTNRSGSGDGGRAAIADAEMRAMDETVGSGGTFVAPSYVTAQWAQFRSPYRTLANQCLKLELPPYGLEVLIPSFTAATPTGSQSPDNTGIEEPTAPAGTFLTANLAAIAGGVTVSQQILDRGGADGLNFDQIVGLQLRDSLDAQIDAYVLTQAIANAGTVTDTNSVTTGTLYADLSTAGEQMADTAGTRLRATHLFTTSDLFGYFAKQLDSSLRPIMVPSFDAEPFASLTAAGDPKAEGWTGHVMPGGVAWYVDDNIPASGANTRLVVARPQTICLFEGEPIPQAYAATEAQNLGVFVSLRAYVAAIPRFPHGVQCISGATYPSSLK
jgi:HK97 family phage major capsid protein